MPPSVMHAPGNLLDGRYRLVARLGQGGFGDVWRAEELLPDGAPFREVALKLLVSDASEAVDWAEEAKLLASFRHPSLVTIYAAGIFATTVTPHSDAPPSPADARSLPHDATIAEPSFASSISPADTTRKLSARLRHERYVAMELLEGQNLAEVARARGRVPWRRVLAWARSAAAALDVIHRASVVHLDLKPANLFLCSDGALKVLDFGIARRSGVEAPYLDRGALVRGGPGDATLRSSGDGASAYAATRLAASTRGAGLVIGTPGYIAPEVLEQRTPTHAADAYALAVCVVLLCTGKLPQLAPDEPATWNDASEVSAWLDAIRTATLRGALREFGAGEEEMPRALVALLRRLLAVEPDARRLVKGGLFALFDEVWTRPFGVPEPPYFAGQAYGADAEGVLFGRDDDLAKLGRELAFEPAIVVQGPPGSGKSSLLAAGLVAQLARSFVDGKDEWVGVPVRTEAELAAALAALAAPESAATGRALVLDPLEDVAREPWIAKLALVAQELTPGLRVLGALRDGATDVLFASAASPAGAALRRALRFVGPPGPAAAKEIVTGPARALGVAIDEVELVAADVRRELGGGGPRLPFVALALQGWWRTRGAKLEGRRWSETHGVAGAVVRHADRVFGELDRSRQAIADEIVLRLSATDGSGVRWEAAELVAAVASATASDPEEARAVLSVLEDALLVRPAVPPLGVDSVEIGHEALLSAWPRLASARLAQMDRLLGLERVREARIAWERADNHAGLLMHGDLLADAKSRAELLARSLGPRDRAYLTASFRRERVRQIGRVAALAVLVALLVAAVIGRHLVEVARREEARVVAALALSEQLGELAARARRADDPYVRTALLAAAIERGSTDGTLAVDLYATAHNLARADFITLARVEGPTFPWDDRFLLANASPTTLALVDFRPSEPDVIEDVDIDADPTAFEQHFKRPSLSILRPHAEALVERVDFPFDTAFATRAADGEVKVFRVRDDGAVALAAVAPLRCIGGLRVASAAPVLACGVERGVARWDMRRRGAGDAVVTTPLAGDVRDVSADGARVAVSSGAELAVWTPQTGAVARSQASSSIAVARLSPSGGLVALLEGNLVEVVEPGAATPPRFSFAVAEKQAIDLRWDPGGADLAVCEPLGGRWYYLRKGARAATDPVPLRQPCSAPRSSTRGVPETVPSLDAAPDLAERDLGAHLPTGGYRLRSRRYLTRDLVVLDPGFGRDPRASPDETAAAAAPLLNFRARDDLGADEAHEAEDSIVAVERDDSVVMVQVGDEMRFYAASEGSRLFVRKGNFLRRCADGRFLAWEAEGSSYRLFDAWTGAAVPRVPREPGLLVGAGSGCRTVFTQRLDGTLVEHHLDGRPPRELGRADGYVFEARPSGAAFSLGSKSPPGLLLAFSSGAVARIDEGTRALTVLGYATPFASALSDGPASGDVLVADSMGVTLISARGTRRELGTGEGHVDWSDLALSADGASLLLASPGRVVALDLARGELLGSFPVTGGDRFARWDDEGSVLLWSFERKGPSEGVVLPRGASLARHVAEAVSNLRVRDGKIALPR